MEELARLFGMNAGIEDLVDVRVARMNVGAAIAGESPTQLTVVLRDGRTLEASSRGPGPEEDAIEAFVRAASTAQAQLTLSAIAQGGRVPFGDAEVSFEGISYKGVLTPWESVGHWLVADGYLFWKAADGSEPKLSLASTPFGDALVLVLANRIPDKDHRQIAATPDFQAAEAAKAKKTRTAFLAVVVVLLVGAGGIYGFDAYRTQKLRDDYARESQARIDGAFGTFSQNPAGLPACTTPASGVRSLLVTADRSSAREWSTSDSRWTDTEMPRYVSSDRMLYVWGTSGDETRIVGWDCAKNAAACASRASVPAAVATPRTVAELLARGQPAPTAPPSATVITPPPPPPPPSASAAPPPSKTKKKKKGR